MIPSLEFVYAALAAQQTIELTERKAEFTTSPIGEAIMSDTMQGNKSNRDPNRYDLPEIAPRRNLWHDGITVPADNSSSSERGGEYQVGSNTNGPKTATPVDPHSFAAAGGFSATL